MLRHPARAVVAAAALATVVTGCARPVVLEPAPHASDPACGAVLLRAPEELAGMPRLSTTSQGSRAWGDTDPVVLRCGVEPPGPSTDRCLRVTDAGSGVVDWVVTEAEDAWVFVTYGRVPAVEVTVPVSAATQDRQPTAALVDLGLAVSATSVQRTCL